MEKQFLPELIEDERISLKKHVIELADKMYQYVAEDRERLARFLPWPNFIKTVEDEIDFIKRCNESWDNQTAAHYGIYRKSDNEYMGNISSFALNWTSCSCEIGYWILGKFEGNGYMSDSVKLIEKTLYSIGFNRIVIRFDPQNERSGSIPRRLKYVHEGTLREAINVDDEFRNLEVYSKLRSEYLKGNLKVIEIGKEQIDDAQKFYSTCGYVQPIKNNDRVVVAYLEDKIVGVSRIACEKNVLVLRGMQVDRALLRNGIGVLMLAKLDEIIGTNHCYCIPHDWLEYFYGQIGFRKIEISAAPIHLQDRLTNYLDKYPQLIMMRKN